MLQLMSKHFWQMAVYTLNESYLDTTADAREISTAAVLEGCWLKGIYALHLNFPLRVLNMSLSQNIVIFLQLS